jgi:hypothetical protein
MSAGEIVALACSLLAAFMVGRVTSHRNADEETADIWESVHEADQQRIETLETLLLRIGNEKHGTQIKTTHGDAGSILTHKPGPRG